MFIKHSDDGDRTPLEGIRLKTLAYGDKTMMVRFRLKQGTVLPRHGHPHEQTGYLVSGRIHLWIEDQLHECMPGDSWSIAGGLEHGAEALEDSVAVEVFSPVREDYLPESGKP